MSDPDTDRQKAPAADTPPAAPVFTRDDHVVEYVHSLLEAAPRGELALDDSRRHDAPAMGRMQREVPHLPPPGQSPEASAAEVAALRSELEQLKFRLELATVDVQVLRTENSRLRTEVSTHAGQQEAARSGMEQALRENRGLQRQVEELTGRLDSYQDSAPPHTSPEDEAPAVAVPDEAPCHAPDISLTSQEAAFISSQFSHLETAPAKEPDPGPSGESIISRLLKAHHDSRDVASRNIHRSSIQEASSPPGPAVPPGTPHRHDAGVYRPFSGPEQDGDTVGNDPLPPELPPPPVPATDDTGSSEDTEATPPDTEPPFDAADIDLEPAADPETVIRKQISRYQSIQQHAAPTRRTSGHTIIS